MFDMLMDMMARKFWINLHSTILPKTKKLKIAECQVEYNKGNTKKIMGYNCYAPVTMPDNPDLKLTGYVTEDIKTDANIIQGIQAIKFAGFPSNTPKLQMWKMTMTAVEVKETVDATQLKAQTYTKNDHGRFKQKWAAWGKLRLLGHDHKSWIGAPVPGFIWKR